MISLDKILKKKFKYGNKMSSRVKKLAISDRKLRSEQIFEEVNKIKNHKCYYCSEMIKNDDDLKIVCEDLMSSYIRINKNILICCAKCKEYIVNNKISEPKTEIMELKKE